MSLRLKLVLALVLLSAFATVAIGVSTYITTSDQLHTSIDRSLADAAREDARPDAGPPHGLDQPAGRDEREDHMPNPVGVTVQELDGTGSATANTDDHIEPDDVDKALAASPEAGTQVLRDVNVDGVPHRVLTVSKGSGEGATMYARSLAETNDALEDIRNHTAVAALIVTIVAALVGWLIARQVTRRLQRLTGVAESVATTGRLDVEVPVGGRDEAGRLGSAFNEMLAALATSKEAQRRLVQDAGHELRTPLTSLRTNVSVLQRYESLRPEDRSRLITDLDTETHELTTLVNELVDLATDRRSDEPDQQVALGALVERVADRARRRTGHVVAVDVDDTVVVGRPQALERAITNLVDNAAKFSADTASPIEISLHGGRVEVCDRGPGIAPDDLTHVFDRFYRATDARSRPGSGLGLAIVNEIVLGHGGTTFAANRDGGGATVGFSLPPAVLTEP